jgi:hypothetical protein
MLFPQVARILERVHRLPAWGRKENGAIHRVDRSVSEELLGGCAYHQMLRRSLS